MFNIRKTILPSLVFSSLVWSATSADNYPVFGLFSRIHKVSGVQQKPSTLAKKAALQWKQTGAIHYTNLYNAADSVWVLSSRDTIIYDAAGNEVVRMTSLAHSGWSKDSMESLDSTVYENGKVIEKTKKSYPRGSAHWVNKDSYTYLNGGKCDQVLIP